MSVGVVAMDGAMGLGQVAEQGKQTMKSVW